MSKVVIIGGGPSAKHVAEKLVKNKDLHVTIIQANRFVEWSLAMPAVLCKPERHNEALAANLAKYEVPKVTYVYGPATRVDPDAKTVTVQQGNSDHSVSFDALIVCTGLDLPVFTPALGVTLEERKAEVRNIAAAIAKASSIAVLGGGVVGVEMAGTLRTSFPDKKVTILCRDGLLKTFPEKRRAKLVDVMKKMKIEVVSGDCADCPTELKLELGTAKVGDQTVTYDVLIPSFSRGPGTKFLAGTALLDEKGYIKVNEYLQSEVCKDIFAVGVGNVKEPLINFAKLDAQWKSASANVLAHLKGKPLKVHKEGAPFMKNPPLLLVSGDKGGWAGFDFSEMPPQLKCCCCNGLGGFPCCPPPCCWCCCGPCCCGVCGGAPEGERIGRAVGHLPFKTFGFHFKGVADVPEQQKMG